MWNRAQRISAAALLCCGAVLITATLATLQWSHEHDLGWNLVMLWRNSSREVVSVITVTFVMLVVLSVSPLVQRQVRRRRS